MQTNFVKSAFGTGVVKEIDLDKNRVTVRLDNGRDQILNPGEIERQTTTGPPKAVSSTVTTTETSGGTTRVVKTVTTTTSSTTTTQ